MSNETPVATPRRVEDSSGPTATLADVDILSDLVRRPSPPPDPVSENRALAALAKGMAENPQNMLQQLVEMALDLCHADTAGISLLEGEVFRWEAVAGVFASYRHGTMPRAASPCGVCIDRNATQLMHLPDRCFPALRTEPRFVEALLIPLNDHGTPVGTVWIVSHALTKRFGPEDERIIRVLAEFASSGWQLWRAAAAAEQATRRKDDFLAVLGHEIRNPLSAIRSAIAVLQHVSPEERTVRAAVDVLDRQSTQLLYVANDLLDVARIATGRLQIQPVPMDARSALADAVQAVSPAIKAREQQLHVDAGQPMMLEADPARITQIFTNLLDNASKYTPHGGTLTVTAAPTADRHIRVVVRDTGIGFAADQAARLFEPFVQLPAPGGERLPGLGIGLALVRHLTELHGGRVDALSDGPGKGSEFVVVLPNILAHRALASIPPLRVD